MAGFENFTIQVDILGKGTPQELDVMSGNTEYHIIFDGVELTTVIADENGSGQWIQTNGNLPQEDVNAIGKAIENHYS